MKKLFLVLSIAGSLFCTGLEFQDTQVNSRFSYMSYGSGFPGIVNINLAHRMQWGKQGLDVGIGGAPLIHVNEIHGFVNYLFYPKPNLDSQMYCGLGTQIGTVVNSGTLGGSFGHWPYAIPQAVIGKSYAIPNANRQRFLQLNASPWIAGGRHKTKTLFFPIFGISAGYGF